MQLRSLSHVQKLLRCQFKNRVPFSLFSSSMAASEEGLNLLLVSEAFSISGSQIVLLSLSQPPQYVASTALMLLSSWCLNDSRAFVEKYNCEPRLRLPAPSLSLLQDVVEERRGFISSMGTVAGGHCLLLQRSLQRL